MKQISIFDWWKANKIQIFFTIRNMDVATNRGNNLVINMLKHRFPNIFKAEQISFINKMLSRTIEKSEWNKNEFFKIIFGVCHTNIFLF